MAPDSNPVKWKNVLPRYLVLDKSQENYERVDSLKNIQFNSTISDIVKYSKPMSTYSYQDREQPLSFKYETKPAPVKKMYAANFYI